MQPDTKAHWPDTGLPDVAPELGSGRPCGGVRLAEAPPYTLRSRRGLEQVAVEARLDRLIAKLIASGALRRTPTQANDLWCADYKGEFMLADKRYCYPLTISDFASRYLICCEALATTKAVYAFTVFERIFKDFGLPLAIRTDNGSPAAVHSSV
jgi:transposase InsO family protein